MTALSSHAQPAPAGSPGGAGSPILVRLGTTLLRRKACIASLWVAIFAGAAMLVGPTLGATEPSVFASGRESFDANARILSTYGSGGTSAPIVPVVTLAEGKTVDSPGVRQELAQAFARLERRVPAARPVKKVTSLTARPKLDITTVHCAACASDRECSGISWRHER